MKTRADAQDIVRLLDVASATMVAHKARLIELDSVIGDGDLGITMEKGFAAAAALAHASTTLEPGAILMKAGMEIVKVAPSTMGTLMGTGFMQGGKAVMGKPHLTAADMTTFLRAFLAGVMERGKAKPGEKTIIDVLIPAVDAMEAYSGEDLEQVWAEAKCGAAKGIEATKQMISQHGKAAVFREKTKGLEDPGGAAVFALISACHASFAI
jgi:dihydroxyacetone kinase-like protein